MRSPRSQHLSADAAARPCSSLHNQGSTTDLLLGPARAATSEPSRPAVIEVAEAQYREPAKAAPRKLKSAAHISPFSVASHSGQISVADLLGILISSTWHSLL